jgi:hypothetical protein
MLHFAVDEEVRQFVDGEDPYLVEVVSDIELMSWSGSAPVQVNDEMHFFVGKFQLLRVNMSS